MKFLDFLLKHGVEVEMRQHPIFPEQAVSFIFRKEGKVYKHVITRAEITTLNCGSVNVTAFVENMLCRKVIDEFGLPEDLK